MAFAPANVPPVAVHDVALVELQVSVEVLPLAIVVGLAASVGAERLIQSTLYGTRPLDPAILVSVAASLLIVAALACFVPAWRASRTLR